MNSFYIKLGSIPNSSKTKVDLTNNQKKSSLFDSSYNPTLGKEIISKPLSEEKQVF